jgi:predicted AAA+ superfamily ATPase
LGKKIKKNFFQETTDAEIRMPPKIHDLSLQQLLTFGGFPEPFLMADKRSYNLLKRFLYEDKDVRGNMKRAFADSHFKLETLKKRNRCTKTGFR